MNVNYKATDNLILKFKMAKMMNKVMEKQEEYANWPTGRFTNILDQTQKDEKPDDTMSQLELNNDLKDWFL